LKHRAPKLTKQEEKKLDIQLAPRGYWPSKGMGKKNEKRTAPGAGSGQASESARAGRAIFKLLGRERRSR
jgi:hypothetical protein